MSDASVLTAMKAPELREFLKQAGVSLGGDKPELIQRLLNCSRNDLTQVMSRGPWSLSAWNEFAAEEFGCPPRGSYADLATNLLAAVSPRGIRFRKLIADFGDFTVSAV